MKEIENVKRVGDRILGSYP